MCIHFLLDRWPPPTGPSPTEAIHPSIHPSIHQSMHAMPKYLQFPPYKAAKRKLNIRCDQTWKMGTVIEKLNKETC